MAVAERERSRRLRWAVGGAVAVAVALRTWIVTGPAAALDGDEATAALMARDIAHGHGYVFFAGQHYMGALEQYLQAPFALVAPDSPVLLRMPQILLAGLSVWLVYVVGLRLLPTPARAAVASGLYAVGPAFTALGGARSRGAYVSCIVVGLLAVLVVLHADRPTARRAAAFGVLCGLGVWLTPVTAMLLVPAALWLAPHLLRRPALPAAAFGGAIVGTAPIWLWSIANDQLAGLTGAAPPTPFTDRVSGLFGAVLPELLGLSARARAPIWPRWTWAPVLLALGAVWAGACWRRRRGLAAVATLRTTGREPIDLLLVAVPICLALYLASGYTWWTDEPRYLLAAAPWLVLGLAALPMPAWQPRPVAVALAAVFALTSAAGIADAYRKGPPTWYRDLRAAGQELAAAGVPTAWADFRIAHPTEVLSGSSVTVAPMQGTPCRFPAETRRVAAAERGAYVVSRGELDRVLGRLAATGVAVTDRWDHPTLSVLLLDRPVSPWELKLAGRARCVLA